MNHSFRKKICGELHRISRKFANVAFTRIDIIHGFMKFKAVVS
jgi:hypothetical protein